MDSSTGSLTIFDIDDTLFHTNAQIKVMKNNRVVKSLSSSQFNTYKLNHGETFDFTDFRSASKFASAKPISRMVEKVKAITHNIRTPESKVIFLTARGNFDNKSNFLATLRKHGLNMDKIRVERAGEILDYDTPTKKYIVIRAYLNTKQFNRVRLFDDSKDNLSAFLKLKREFPKIQFEAYLANPDGSIRTMK